MKGGILRNNYNRYLKKFALIKSVIIRCNHRPMRKNTLYLKASLAALRSQCTTILRGNSTVDLNLHLICEFNG